MAAVAIPLIVVLGIACALPYLSTRAVDRASTLEANSSYDSALVQDDLAISLDPLSTDALLDRAGVLQELGRPSDAAADVRKALALSPANADTWIAASSYQYPAWHDKDGACTSARVAVSLSPHSPSAAGAVSALISCR
jgi:tetratricopeptide (TPR) repeat protein